jgi:hypothetical protein
MRKQKEPCSHTNAALVFGLAGLVMVFIVAVSNYTQITQV